MTKQHKCIKGHECKGRCIPKSSACKDKTSKIVAKVANTVSNAVKSSRSTATVLRSIKKASSDELEQALNDLKAKSSKLEGKKAETNATVIKRVERELASRSSEPKPVKTPKAKSQPAKKQVEEQTSTTSIPTSDADFKKIYDQTKKWQDERGYTVSTSTMLMHDSTHIILQNAIGFKSEEFATEQFIDEYTKLFTGDLGDIEFERFNRKNAGLEQALKGPSAFEENMILQLENLTYNQKLSRDMSRKEFYDTFAERLRVSEIPPTLKVKLDQQSISTLVDTAELMHSIGITSHHQNARPNERLKKLYRGFYNDNN